MGDILKPVGKPEIKFQGKLIQLVHQQMTNGEHTKTFEYAERAPGVRMIIVNNDDKICITKERRAEINMGKGGYDYRLPGGKVFDRLEIYNTFRENGGDLKEAAKDAVMLEAKEEVGIIPQELTLYSISECGATMRRDLYYFIITKFEDHPKGQHLGASENIEVLRLSREDVKKICLDGSMQEDRSAAVVMRWLR